MTHLRHAMLEELQRRNYAKTTVDAYLHGVDQFAKHFKRSPDRLTLDHLRTYQAYLLRERKLGPRTVRLHVAALRFFFVKTLRRRYSLDDTPYPKVPPRLPTILTIEEVKRLIASDVAVEDPVGANADLVKAGVRTRDRLIGCGTGHSSKSPESLFGTPGSSLRR